LEGDVPLEKLIAALVAFILGLLAKFIYDMWNDRRKRKSLIFVKTIISSFTLSDLEKDIREQTQVIYSGHPVRSIHLVRVEVENDGSVALANQAFTVRFSKDAQIIGEPQSKSSEEDLKFVERDLSSDKQNSLRFIIKLLQKRRRLSWDLAVINHTDSDFVVEHGIAATDEKLEGVDLDVFSTITNEKAKIDLIGRIRRILVLVMSIPIVIIIQKLIAFALDYFNSNFSIFPIANIAILWLLLLVVRDIWRLIKPLMSLLTKKETDTKLDVVIDNTRCSNITIAGKSAQVANKGTDD
jgi:hypothetical protein